MEEKQILDRVSKREGADKDSNEAKEDDAKLAKVPLFSFPLLFFSFLILFFSFILLDL